MVHRNGNFAKFKANYLFVDIANRRKAFCDANPTAKLISLGIGDTTEPLPSPIIDGFIRKAQDLSTAERYSGYPDYNGSAKLRQLIADTFYSNLEIHPDEIFISDGSKPDLARIQLLFGPQTTIAVQDPVYPAYVDGAVISGKAGDYNESEGRYSSIVYMSCTPENGFFPDLSKVKRTHLIYFCSPNNPTGMAATKSQLEELVRFAENNNSFIIFDAAYSQFTGSPPSFILRVSEYIQDPDVPHSIYSIEGSKRVAFETQSFSKLIGFTGVRLGWTVCPRKLEYEGGTPVWDDWARIMGTCFNGPSNLAEEGGIATLSPEGLRGMREMTSFYLENATIIREAMERLGFSCYGGRNSPYIWVRIPGKDSWAAFQELLEKAHVVTTPGVGFGREGAGFIRISGFAHRQDVLEAVARITKALSN
ncbi:uncharacterized protein LOC129617413 [Condylostylus longicornis]|uniref:uncharacterized protein LOC129617413 n=1 Tax=Condylostylus longicornis TaxID=2530218 RepID=UPI00244E3AF5|nr:uncharacterized protein LOC129617413 [Condylostylus longicornis]